MSLLTCEIQMKILHWYRAVCGWWGHLCLSSAVQLDWFPLSESWCWWHYQLWASSFPPLTWPSGSHPVSSSSWPSYLLSILLQVQVRGWDWISILISATITLIFGLGGWSIKTYITKHTLYTNCTIVAQDNHTKGCYTTRNTTGQLHQLACS